MAKQQVNFANTTINCPYGNKKINKKYIFLMFRSRICQIKYTDENEIF